MFQAEFVIKTYLNFWLILSTAHNQTESKTKPHVRCFVLLDDSLNVPTAEILNLE